MSLRKSSFIDIDSLSLKLQDPVNLNCLKLANYEVANVPLYNNKLIKNTCNIVTAIRSINIFNKKYKNVYHERH